MQNRLNRVPIIALFTANAISMIGNVLTNIAIPWFVLQTTGSATQTGLVGFFTCVGQPAILDLHLSGAVLGDFGGHSGIRDWCRAAQPDHPGSGIRARAR